MTDIRKTAREVLEAYEANHPTPTTFMVGPDAMRRTSLMAARAPELARHVETMAVFVETTARAFDDEIAYWQPRDATTHRVLCGLRDRLLVPPPKEPTP